MNGLVLDNNSVVKCHEQQRGKGPWGHNLGVYKGSLETYTRYSRVADEEQKKVLSVFE